MACKSTLGFPHLRWSAISQWSTPIVLLSAPSSTSIAPLSSPAMPPLLPQVRALETAQAARKAEENRAVEKARAREDKQVVKEDKAREDRGGHHQGKGDAAAASVPIEQQGEHLRGDRGKWDDPARCEILWGDGRR